MSGWKFERLLQSPTLTASGVGPLVFDGRDVWTAAINGDVSVLSYWDASANSEYLGQEWSFDNVGPFKMKLVTTFNVCKNGGQFFGMVKNGNYVYVWEVVGNISHISKWDITTKTNVPSGDHTISRIVDQQKIACANNKLWFTNFIPDPVTDQQYLFYLDLNTNTESTPVVIPGKKQYILRDMADGLNNKLYVTSLNEHSVMRFSTIDGSYIDAIRVNRMPYRLHVNQRRTVYVASDAQTAIGAGMISACTQPNTGPETVTAFSCAGGELNYFWDTNFTVDDDTTGHLWFMGKNAVMVRLDKATKDMRFTKGTSPGFTIELAWTKPDGTALTVTTTGEGSLVTPPLTMERWNGTSFEPFTVKSYLFFIGSDAKIYAARLSAMVRVNMMDVLGTAMVATGPQNYYGDFT